MLANNLLVTVAAVITLMNKKNDRIEESAKAAPEHFGLFSILK